MNEPITIRVRSARSNVKPPEGMEISMNADGSGGAVPEKNPAPAKKIGPQGLGVKGNNGYSIGSPSKKKDACYSKVASRYKGGNSAYRSGAMVKCRKVGAANWGNKSK
tara:strand:+ start:3208 stop:3531 length:324 start_codon:yes stop_codon:yes gene_type:complete